MNSFRSKILKKYNLESHCSVSTILAFEVIKQPRYTYVTHKHIFLFFKALYNWIFLENEVYLHIYFYIYISSAKWTAKSSIFKDDLMRKLFETIKLNQMTYSPQLLKNGMVVYFGWKIVQLLCEVITYIYLRITWSFFALLGLEIEHYVMVSDGSGIWNLGFGFWKCYGEMC